MQMLRVAILCAVGLGLTLTAASARAEAPLVKVHEGALRGVTAGDVSSFKGVPYAAPPLEGLRWRPPAPPASWKGERDASKFGAACHQFEEPAIVPPGIAQSEDCLTLNVWKPAKPSSKPLPVMVWVHGGSFTTGTGAGPFFTGDRFTSLGVIAITLNYRLGALGFFAHPALTRADPKGPLANYGLLDQLAALRWVKANIAAFGGDPARVTLFGESSGANSVYALLVSPLARGLFQRAIAQSGFPRSPRSTLQRVTPKPAVSAESEGLAFAKTLGVEGDGPASLQALRRVPVDRLKQAFSPIAQKFNSYVDGVVVPRLPIDAIRDGQYLHVPVMLGATNWEASLWKDGREDPEAVLRSTGDRSRALALFDPSGKLGRARAAEDLLTDQRALEPARRVAELLSAQKVPAFLYRFSYLPAASRDKMPGAPHAGEIGYVFGTLPKEPFKTFINGVIPAATPEDLAMSNAMSSYWAAFATTGDPGAAGGPRWPAYADPTRATLDFAVGGPVVRPALNEPRLDWLRSLSEPAARTPARAPAAP